MIKYIKQMNIENYILNQKKFINNHIKTYLEKELLVNDVLLKKAINYALLNGGKRIRPIICLASSGNKNFNKYLYTALALEFFHCSTLIHDDLPCMDNDIIRRGKPTCHIKFGEANAILAGDALLIESFNLLTKQKNYSSDLIKELASASGANGVIAGQVSDLASEGKRPSSKLVNRIHYNKTAILIRAAVRMGVICSENRKKIKFIEEYTKYGEKIGMAFQIQDDILNITSESKKIGKTAGSDESKSKMTYPYVFGLKKAKKKEENLTKEAILILKSINEDTNILEKIALFLSKRVN